jgi:hypothetical protein
MDFLTQMSLGEIRAFLQPLNDNLLLSPSWNNPIPSAEDPNRVSLARTSRGTVRTLKAVVDRAMTRRIGGRRYGSENLVDFRNGASEGSMTLGALIASIRSWKEVGE